MALVGAVNPDFGQVEVDPAVVNLTAFETFFEEKRPFFTEGSQVFLRFGRSGASEYTTYFYPEPQLFYSRRIGRAPQGRAARRLRGLAHLHDDPRRREARRPHEERLERRPARGGDRAGVRAGRRRAPSATRSRSSRSRTTSWAARSTPWARAASIGFLGTAVVRDLDTPGLDGLLVDRAFVGGVDGHVFLDPTRDWVVSGGLSGSTVSGSPASVLRVQRAAQRYYQRPDAPHVSVDPTATSLSGWSGRVGLNKNSGNVTFNAGLWGISPGFEPNDLGFATQTRPRRRPRARSSSGS